MRVFDGFPSFLISFVSMPGRVVFGNKIEKVRPFVTNGKPDCCHSGRFRLAFIESRNRSDDFSVVSMIGNVVELGDFWRTVSSEFLAHFGIGKKSLCAIGDVLSFDANELAVSVRGVGVVNQVAYGDGVAVGVRADERTANSACRSEKGDSENNEKRHRSAASYGAVVVRVAPGESACLAVIHNRPPSNRWESSV